jgi:hypothetical protein
LKTARKHRALPDWVKALTIFFWAGCCIYAAVAFVDLVWTFKTFMVLWVSGPSESTAAAALNAAAVELLKHYGQPQQVGIVVLACLVSVAGWEVLQACRRTKAAPAR